MNAWNLAARAAAAVIAAAAFATAANAGSTSANLTASATVSATCTLSTSPIAFGPVDTIGGSNVDASGGITVTCTNGAAWTAAAGVGSGTGATFASRKLKSGTDLLNYSLYTDSARTNVWGDGTTGTATFSGTGMGSSQNVTVYGRIGAGQTTVPTGSYSDTVSVTVSY